MAVKEAGVASHEPHISAIQEDFSFAISRSINDLRGSPSVSTPTY